MTVETFWFGLRGGDWMITTVYPEGEREGKASMASLIVVDAPRLLPVDNAFVLFLLFYGAEKPLYFVLLIVTFIVLSVSVTQR